MASPSKAAPPKTTLPRIVLVGPTNVGKSTLFNRLTKSRKAIVADRPGVTVDRHEMRLDESPIGPVEIVDTGGVGPEALRYPLGAEIERSASRAVEGAAVVLFVVDGTRECGVDELEVARWLRRQRQIDKTPIWVIVNKSDAKDCDESSYFSLGFDHLLKISAEHGYGILDIWDALNAALGSGGPLGEPVPEIKPEARIMVLGRPNVGKSTLLNAILGDDRHVVSEVAGTTRDVIESEYQRHGHRWRLVDTAGMRKPGRLEREVEWVAREKLKEAAREADIAVIVFDASEGISDMDASIAGLAVDFGLSVVLAINKTDRLQGGTAEQLVENLERTKDLKLDFLHWVPKVAISALTGRGVGELLKTVDRVLEGRRTRAQTSKLNALFEKKMRLHHHPLGPRGKTAKFYYLSQVSVSPPEFVLFSNLPGSGVHFSYRRFITNCLREEFGFEGTPIKLHFKQA